MISPAATSRLSAPAGAAGAAHALELSRLLLSLHRALTLEEFWRSLRVIVGAVLPSHSISLYLNYFDIGRDFRALHHQSQPGGHQPWEERRKVSPTPHFLRTHVGRKIFGSRELLPDTDQLRDTEYFKRVMAIEGWRSIVCLAYWRKATPRAMIVVRRGDEQGGFSARETALLETLYEHFETALGRIERMQEEQAALACLASCLPFYPLGLMALNAACEPVFRNQEALEACLCWNHGADALRRMDPAKAFEVPPAVLDTCRELAACWHASEGCAGAEPAERPVLLAHPAHPEWKISVGLVHAKNHCLSEPFFLVQCAKPAQPETSAVSAEAVLRLQELTPAERQVALAAAAGCSNAEIALQLNKSFVTVRAHLHAVFTKLGVRRRSQLAVLLR